MTNVVSPSTRTGKYQMNLLGGRVKTQKKAQFFPPHIVEFVATDVVEGKDLNRLRERLDK